MPRFLDVTDTSAARTALGAVGKDDLVIDFRDHGLIGDGTSRPLSGLYGTLAEAQDDYPSALDLTDELDWAAIQSAADANPGGSFIVPSTVHAIINRPINLTDSSKWTVDGVIENIWPRNTPTAAQWRSNVFHGGMMHPWVLTDNEGHWTTYSLDDIAEGDRSVTVTDPTGLTLTVGEKVIVRSSTGQHDYNSGNARIYDYCQFNKVESYDPVTGVVTFEVPIGETVGSTSTMTGPVLCVNPGSSDPQTNLPYQVLDGWELSGRGTLIGYSPFGYKTGMWNCRVQIRAECQMMMSANACNRSHFEITGTFTSRIVEVAMFSWESTFILDGVYKPDPEAIVYPTITIHEQSTGINMDVRGYRGSDHLGDATSVMFQDKGIRSKVRAELYDYSPGGPSYVAYIGSTQFTNRPVVGGDYDFFIRSGGSSKANYLLVGSSSVDDTAHPQRLRWRMDAISEGAAPSYLDRVTNGTLMVRGDSVADAVRCNLASTAIEAPENAIVLAGTVAGAVTYTANTETLVSSYTLTGPKFGDHVEVTSQMLQAPTSGTYGDLYLTATVSGANAVRVYVRNRSGTDVVFPAGNIFFVFLRWKRCRP